MTLGDRYESIRRKGQVQGEQAALLDLFGDHIAVRERYKALDGREAIWLYLIKKYHWLPRDVRSMADDDLLLLLAEELQAWTPPAAPPA